MKINFVNSDHVHTLIDLPTNISIEECIKLLKGSSSHFINQNRLTGNKFQWGKGYDVFSVSPSQLKKAEDYIRTQEKHHQSIIYREEYSLFLEKYGINING
jgi:REP element-mobilizing transposase RayT